MKNLIILFSLILSFTSCIQNEEERINDNSIVGTWKLVENFVDTSLENNGEWKSVENGYIYTFMLDGTFYSNKFPETTQGTYNLTDVLLTLEFNCNDFSSGFFETPNGTLVESYRIINNELFLSPRYVICEGCLWKFKKVAE